MFVGRDAEGEGSDDLIGRRGRSGSCAGQAPDENLSPPPRNADSEATWATARGSLLWHEDPEHDVRQNLWAGNKD
jgi:hypothetical protein